jgi:hypothetical protein
MKKLILLSLGLLTISQLILGQSEKPIHKGNFLTGGSFSFNFDKTKEYDPIPVNGTQVITTIIKKEINSDLYFGYYVFNHLALGLKTDISFLNEKHSVNIDGFSFKYGLNDVTFGPFIRYSTSLGLFIEGNAGIGLIKHRQDDNSEKWKDYLFGLGIGYSFFISNSVAIEPVIKYHYLHTPPYFFEEANSISNGISFGVGFQIYFGSKD